MRTIDFEQASDPVHAVRLAQQANTMFIGGGTNLIDLMKGDVEQPARLVDISHIGLAEIEALPDGGLRIGAFARNSDTANHALVRTRCPYFTDTAFAMCNKCAPGSGCGAREGVNRVHTIRGASPTCTAVNPSDMNVALAALDAVVQVTGPQGARSIPVADFHRLPGSTPQVDTVLKPAELITAVNLPPPAFSRHTHYLKIRDRASYAFARVSVAAALDMQDGVVRQARIALGGVAHKPWRVPAAEALLAGQPLDDARSAQAAAVLLEGAQGYRDNSFKIRLAQRAIVRALREAGDSA